VSPRFSSLAPTKAASQGSVGYDVYDLYDLGEFDQKGGRGTNWGTKEEFIALIKKLYDLGIVTYIDAVLNHRFVSFLYLMWCI
jgi:alpha-amylase